jgi:hypothetical protein
MATVVAMPTDEGNFMVTRIVNAAEGLYTYTGDIDLCKDFIDKNLATLSGAVGFEAADEMFTRSDAHATLIFNLNSRAVA